MHRNVLTARPEFPGFTETRDPVGVKPGRPGEQNAPELLILIHGYQNSEKKARQSFDRLISNLRALSLTGDTRRFGAIWEYHWPGDHPNWVASVASYPLRVGVARDAGRLLADYLENRDPRQSVHIVAHSLGCRIALHAAHAIRQRGARYDGARLGRLFLLAAAVPVPLCIDKPGQPYPSPLPGSIESVFYSRCDLALVGFPLGQIVIGERGPAVGRDGYPVNRWSRVENTSLTHGKYWGSHVVSEAVANAFGPSLVRLTRRRAVDELATDTRRLPSCRLPDRSLVARDLPP